MNISEIELAAAKRLLEKMQRDQINAARMKDPSLTKEDRELMKKYPRHTLAAARLIDATPLQSGVKGNRDSFHLIRKQETHGRKINDSHT